MQIKRIVSFFLILVSVCLYSCGDDFQESGIEGRWQLNTIESVDSKEIIRVDTVFYSFKKNVFEYLKLTSPVQYFHCFGNYETNGDRLNIKIDKDSFEPSGCDTCFDWSSTEKSFLINKHTSSKLELESEGIVYSFRKY